MPVAGISRCSTRCSTTSRFPARSKLRRLSNGQRASVALALAIAPDPDLLVLDDPTLGLDTVARRDFLMSMIHLVQRRGRTILFSSHILADVERVADRIGILVDGVLRVDCPTERFKEGVSKLVLEFPGRPPAFPGCAGLVQAWEVGHRLELVIVDFGDRAAPGRRIAGAAVLGRRGPEPRRRLRRLHPRAQAILARLRRRSDRAVRRARAIEGPHDHEHEQDFSSAFRSSWRRPSRSGSGRSGSCSWSGSGPRSSRRGRAGAGLL